MKTAGIVIIIAGLLMTLYSGFSFITEEKVVDLGAVEITKDNQHNVYWPSYAGVGAIIIGGAIILFGRKKALIA